MWDCLSLPPFQQHSSSCSSGQAGGETSAFQQQQLMSEPNDCRLRSGPYLGEISGLCFLHLPLPLSSLPYLLAGTGSQLLLYDLETGKLLKSFHVFQAAAEVGDKRGTTDTFFAEESVSWTSLGISDRLSRALNNVGLGRPSLVQVFDEAHMLLYGSFQNQAIRLINLFRFDEKLLSRATKAVVEKPEDPCSDSLIASEFQDDKDLPTELNLPEEEGAEDDTVLEELTEGIDVKCTKRKDWRRNI
ncbi:hypothetical protein RHMOL_Rhmol13G0014600 [Rhododendron molle]|uniref:Uncharacterized protein n=1 Tax=Rhododendron molle TaxID=49168 RepID=A0ACC0L3A2_RHOML|nr:hypothetical protein RHMOL_Rhmol13G0014600 [Rhododendron molle]